VSDELHLAATPMRSPAVGIVLLNWNRSDLLAACLDSIFRSDFVHTRILVVDNGSSDDSPSRLRAAYPTVEVIENGRNLGFAAANNVGIRRLLATDVDCLLLLNDDTEISPTMLGELVEALYSDDRIGVVGPTIFYHADRRRIWFSGGAVDRFGQAGHPGADELDSAGDERVRDVDYITGCALMVKRSVFEQVGLLDERFFAYYEETEFCARVRAAGYRVLLVPWASMWHKVRPDDRPSSPMYLYLMTRNRLLYLRCTSASALTQLTATVDILRTAMSLAVRPRHRARRGHASTLVRGVSDFLRARFGPPPPAVMATGRRERRARPTMSHTLRGT
jgi:hypothetical protein